MKERVVSRSVDTYIAPITASIASAKIEDLSAGAPLALAQQQEGTQIEFPSDLRERGCVDDGCSQFGKLPLGLVGKVPKQPFGDDNAQDGVAEEFQALVGG